MEEGHGKSLDSARKRKARSLIFKVDGQNRYNIYHQLRETDDSLIFSNKKKSYRFFPTTHSGYKSIPLEKFIALPPEYKLGIKRRIQPFKGFFDKCEIYKNQAGTLVVPKHFVYYDEGQTSKTPNSLNERNFKRKLKAINFRIKELSKKMHPSLAKNLELIKKRKLILDDLRPDPESRTPTLSPNQQQLLKIFDKKFNSY